MAAKKFFLNKRIPGMWRFPIIFLAIIAMMALESNGNVAKFVLALIVGALIITVGWMIAPESK